MEQLFLRLLVVFILLWQAGCKRPKPRLPKSCAPADHRYYIPESNKCKRCPRCGLGMGLNPDKKDIQLDPDSGLPLTCYKCTPCQAGSYSENSDYSRCRLCTNCSALARHEDRRCDGRTNTLCGRCKPMYIDRYAKLYKDAARSRACQHCRLARGKISPRECAPYRTTTTSTPTGTVSTQGTSPSPRPTVGNPKAEPFRAISDDKPIYFPMVISILAVLSVMGFIGVTALIKIKRIPPPSRVRGELPAVSYTSTGTNGQTIEVGGRGAGMTSSTLDVDGDVVNQPLLSTEAAGCEWNTQLTFQQKVCLRQVGSSWPDLARNLCLTEADIDCLRQDKWESEGERIHQMILTWERMYPDKANLKNVVLALNQLGKRSLINLLTKQNESRS